MPRRKVPDNIPLPDNLDSPREILRRALHAQFDDGYYGSDKAGGVATVVTKISRLSEIHGDEEGRIWWT